MNLAYWVSFTNILPSEELSNYTHDKQINILISKNQLGTGSRQVVVSREAKKKQHVHASLGLHNHYSELCTQMADQNF